MNAVPIVQCAQCPSCRTYVPILSDLVRDAPAARPFTNVLVNDETSRLTYRPRITSSVPNPEPVQAAISTSNSNVIQTRLPVNPPGAPLSQYEESWRSTFWKLPVLIHGIVEIVLTVLIIILEIATLSVSTYSATGAGFWCSFSFLPAGVLTVRLVTKWDRSRLWATRVCIAQIVLLVFCFILIGIVGNYVSTQQSVASLYSTYSISSSSFSTKYQIMQTQLAFAILLLFAGIAYIIYYGVVTYLALWKEYGTLDTSHLFSY